MFTHLPSEIFINGVKGSLEGTERQTAYHYYFCDGRHVETITFLRSSIQSIDEVISSLGIDLCFVGCRSSKYAFPEFDYESDLLKFINYLASVGLIGSRDDHERFQLGIKR